MSKLNIECFLKQKPKRVESPLAACGGGTAHKPLPLTRQLMGCGSKEKAKVHDQNNRF